NFKNKGKKCRTKGGAFKNAGAKSGKSGATYSLSAPGFAFVRLALSRRPYSSLGKMQCLAKSLISFMVSSLWGGFSSVHTIFYFPLWGRRRPGSMRREQW